MTTTTSTTLDELLASDDLEEVARLLVVLEDRKRQADDAVSVARGHLLACLQGRNLKSFDSLVGRCEIHFRKSRKAWRWDELTEALLVEAKERRVLRSSGEVEPLEVTVLRVLRECVGFSYGKIDALKRYGLDPDEFCESGPAVAEARVVV